MRASHLLCVSGLMIVLACTPVAAQVTVATLAAGHDPASVAVDSSTNTVYVGNVCGDFPYPCANGGGSVTVINGATLATQTVETGAFYPNPVVVNSTTHNVYAATCGSDTTCAGGTVTIINGTTLATNTINSGFYTDWIALNTNTNTIYAVNECNDSACTTPGTVTVINGNTLSKQTVTVGADALSAVVNPDTYTIYVVNKCGNDITCSSAGTVTVINGSTLTTQTVNVGFTPLSAAVDTATNTIYVANNGGADGTGNPGTVSVINGNTLAVQTVNVGIYPAPVLVNPNTNTIYVGNRCGSDPNCIQPPSVSIINGSTLGTSTVSICKTETFPANLSDIDLAANKVYFPCQGRSDQGTYGLSLSVLDGLTSTVTPIAVGDYPNAAGINSVTDQIYVPNQADNTVSVGGGNTKLQLVNVTPCRVVDTRQANGPFGGPIMQADTTRRFPLPQNSNCNIPSSAAAYSLNVTVVPQGPLGYLAIWPTPEIQPATSTLNSLDGRVKANAAVVPAGVSGAVSVYVTNTTDVILDIDGYFAPTNSQTLQFYAVTPCRVVDTREGSNQPPGLGPPSLGNMQTRDLPILSSPCLSGITGAAAYSFNVTAVPYPAGQPLNYLTVWPSDEQMPGVSTLNNPTATVVANATVVPADPSTGDIDVYAYNSTDVIMDINGYFAPAGTDGYNLYPAAPCRAYDSRNNNGQPFEGERTVPIASSPCAPPANTAAYVFNATVVPSGVMPYLTLWPDTEPQPTVSTLNAYDGYITSNMAIVPNLDGSIDAYAAGLTQLILDISGYFAP